MQRSKQKKESGGKEGERSGKSQGGLFGRERSGQDGQGRQVTLPGFPEGRARSTFCSSCYSFP